MKARFLALAALVLGLASCQTEHEGLNVNVGGEQETYVTVSLPETTRANSAHGAFDNVVASNDYTIRYIFQVFYNGNESGAARQVIYTDDNRVSFPVRLVPGRHYNFVVWADVTTTADKELDTIHNLTIAEAAAADIHYNTMDLKDVRIIDNQWVAMDETRDAFTGQFDTAVDGDHTEYNSAKSINFTLKRPFAKLRVITTDMKQLNDLTILPTYATVEYTKPLYPSFNAFAGVVNNETSTAPHKTHYQYTIKTDYEYDFNNDEPKVLFTDYLFAPDYDHEVNFILTVYDQHGKGTENVIKTNNFNTPIPAQRNYLTTISGNILTDGNNITVDVSKDFENTQNPGDAPYYQETISSDVELLAALAKLQEPGANYKFIVIAPLTVDYSLISTLAATRAASTTSGSVTINLNGFIVTFVSNGNEPVITLPAGSELTLVNDSNEGGIIVTGEGTGAAIQNNGSLNIEGVALQSESNGAVIENNNVANIEGSTLNEGALVNNEDGEATITGSTLNEGAVENNGAANIEESTLNQGAVENNGAANIEGSELAAGSVENNGQANVSGGTVDNNAIENGEGAIVGSQSAEDLQRAINRAKAGEPNVFALTGNVVGNITISQSEGINITIDGKGNKFDGTIYVDGNSRNPAAETLLIQNVNFESATDKDFIWADDASVENRYPHNITIKDCTFTGLEGAEVVAIRCRQTYNLTIKDCQATNVHSFGQITSTIGITISDVTVNGQSGFNFLTSAANASITNCGITATKEDGYGIRVVATGANTMNVKNCTIAAFRPIVLRSTEAVFTLELDGNTLTPTDKYHIYVESGVLPTLNGADDLIVYPRDVVSSWDEFTAALAKNNKNIVLTADITYDKNYTITKDVTIDLNGKTFEISNATQTLNLKANVTIKNGNFNGKMYPQSGKVTISDVNFGGKTSGEAQLQIKGGNVYVKNCVINNSGYEGDKKPRSLTIEGRSSDTVKFENCQFKSTKAERVYVNQIKGTAKVEFIGCNFSIAPVFAMTSGGLYENLNIVESTSSLGISFEMYDRTKAQGLTEAEAEIINSIFNNNKISSAKLYYSDGTVTKR